MSDMRGHNAARTGSGEVGFQRRTTGGPEIDLEPATASYRLSPDSVLAGRHPLPIRERDTETWAAAEIDTTFVDPMHGKVREIVTARLHRIGNNPTPHFSLVHSLRAPGRDLGGGAGHEDILRRHPDLAPVARVHLADDSGRPMHAATNASYWAGGSRFKPEAHGSTVETDEHGTWNPIMLARHLRVSQDEARAIRRRVYRREVDLADERSRCSVGGCLRRAGATVARRSRRGTCGHRSSERLCLIAESDRSVFGSLVFRSR